MLNLLHIENIAVIEQADIEFKDGLTVLTGETGAGKSIIIDSINAILGQRTSKSLVRTGAQKGFVSAIFTDISPELNNILEEMELVSDEPNTLYVQRQISADGKSVSRINMRPITASVLKTIAPYLINIHGQHDGQKLMDECYHIEFLDSFAESSTLLAKYYPLYQKLFDLKKQITELDKSEQERLQKIDMLQFHLNEIEDAQLICGEEEKLLEKKAIFDNASHLISALNLASIALNGIDDDSLGALSMLSEASNALANINDVSTEFASIYERAEEVKFLAQDVSSSISSIREHIDFSPAEASMLEERLDIIYHLKQKYGESIEEILEYSKRISIELETLTTADETRDRLLLEYKETLATAKKIANELSDLRKTCAKNLQSMIINELCDLDMNKAQFEIRVEVSSKLNSRGFDNVSFLISVNPGEPPKQLSQVASGGELSRIMLAMKNVLTANEPVGTLIFDEIDTGVSGRAAQKIARKLSEISKYKQTICVTHLPQIAAMGDNHLLIAKNIMKDRSFTSLTKLEGDMRADEIARMISGENITEISRSSARELITAATLLKK